MNNAYEDGHLEGETVDNVGQDDNANTQEGSGNWEDQAKYFQSEKDKLAAENSRLKQYEKIGQLLESRPDITQTITGMVQGQGQPTQPERIALDKDEFDPWEAYNDPQSKSYKFRQQELQDSINGAVNQQMQGLQKTQGEMQLKTELQQRGLAPEEVDSFMNFAAQNPAEYGVDGAINMWQAVTQKPTESGSKENPLDAIRQNQAVPQQAGILNGQQPVKKSVDEERWKGILSASTVGNKIP
jgi:predicted RNA-binding protein with PUA-like domain